MKKLLIIIVAIFSPLLIMAKDYYSVTADVLNIRNHPSKNGAVVGARRKGDVVLVLSTENGGWKKIATSSISGYVSSQYLKYSYTEDYRAPQSEKRSNTTFKKLIWKILGWIIPILLIIISFSGGDKGVWYDVYEDGTMVKRKPKDDGGCALFFIGLIWLGIKIYNLF